MYRWPAWEWHLQIPQRGAEIGGFSTTGRSHSIPWRAAMLATIDDRLEMRKWLQKLLVPRLRERGFDGSFPYFRRHGEGQIDLLSVQFDKFGGSFIIEVGQTPDTQLISYRGREIKFSDLRSFDLPTERRARLVGSRRGGEKWFSFKPRLFRSGFQRFEQAAASVVALIEQADDWWDGNRDQPNIRPLVS